MFMVSEGLTTRNLLGQVGECCGTNNTDSRCEELPPRFRRTGRLEDP